MELLQVRDKLLVRNADIAESHFQDVRLVGSGFEGVNLRASTFHDADFSGATLTNVNLSNVRIRAATLTGLTIDGVLVTDLLAAYRAGDRAGDGGAAG